MENVTIYNTEFENDATSVNNNSVMATNEESSAQEDAFDRLLDEFIRKKLDEDVRSENCGGGSEGSDDWDDEFCDCNDDEYDDEDIHLGEYVVNDPDEVEDVAENGFAEFAYGSLDLELGGTVYKMPKVPYSCKASKLVLHNCDYEEYALTGEPLVFVSASCDNLRATFVLHSVSDYEEYCPPLVYLYSASQGNPIDRMAMHYDDDDKQATLLCEDVIKSLPCGNYFFYLFGVEVDGLSTVYNNCNGGCCIPFVKVDGDMELPSVALEAAGVKTGSRYCSLDVSLKFDKMLGKEYAYTLFLYNRNYNLVSRGATFSWDNYSVRKRKNLLTHMTATYIPFGAYRLFVLQNGIPRWKVEFFVEGGKATVTAFSDIKQFGNEFLLLYGLEKESDWHRFREGDATVEMKEYFLSTYQRSFLNKKRRAMGLNALSTSMHFVYNGGNSVSELKGLESMSRMFWNVSCFDSVDCTTLTEVTAMSTPTDRITELFGGCNNKCIALYNMTALAGNGSLLVNKMIDAMDRYSSFSVCLIGSSAEIGQFFGSFPQLKRYFSENDCISGGEVFAETVVDKVVKVLRECDLRLSLPAMRFLVDTVQRAQVAGCFRGLKMADVCDFVKDGIIGNFVNRIMSSADKDSIADKAYLTTVEASDIDKEKIMWNRENGFEESIRQLNMMVGLSNVKQNIITTFNRLKICVERRRLGLKVKGGECHHMLFTGNPGTGKTTVAKMMGRIYRSLGLLSKGDVVFVDRGKIVGSYIGDTERNMQRILQEARGNILFIDEAYTLCDGSDDRKDFGHRAIECLLTVMAQEECDMIVIFAGYSKGIEMMMRSNQGLSGRFPYKFEFADYSADELMQIAEQRLSQEDYELTPEARDLLYKTIEDAVLNKEWDFYNARWVGQYVDNGIIPAQCERLMRCSAPKSRDDYRMINVEDIVAAYALHKPAKKNCKIYRGIGFTA